MNQNDVVEYDFGGGFLKGRGKVVGIASTEMAVIGRVLIVEDLSGNIPNDTYPYTHFSIPEIHLKKI